MVGMESPRFGGGTVYIPVGGVLLPFERDYDEAAAVAWVNEGLPDPDVYLGDARIVIDDLAAPNVDVSFTKIHNVTDGTRHHDMVWADLSVQDGLFGEGNSVWLPGEGDPDEYIAGMFTCPGIKKWAVSSARMVSRVLSERNFSNFETGHGGNGTGVRAGSAAHRMRPLSLTAQITPVRSPGLAGGGSALTARGRQIFRQFAQSL